MIIKVCGMRDPANIAAVEKLRPDLMGYIFYEKSARYVGASFSFNEQSSNVDKSTKTVGKVGVFVNLSAKKIISLSKQVGLTIAQLHGDEKPEMIPLLQQAGLQVIKAFGVDADFDFSVTDSYSADYFLFDTKSPKRGGTGRTYDWDILQYYKGKTPFLLSGGLRPGMEESILSFAHPAFAGIDLNSGFETEPALKDISQLSKFVNTIRNEAN